MSRDFFGGVDVNFSQFKLTPFCIRAIVRSFGDIQIFEKVDHVKLSMDPGKFENDGVSSTVRDMISKLLVRDEYKSYYKESEHEVEDFVN
jgi:hypothetical protein